MRVSPTAVTVFALPLSIGAGYLFATAGSLLAECWRRWSGSATRSTASSRAGPAPRAPLVRLSTQLSTGSANRSCSSGSTGTTAIRCSACSRSVALVFSLMVSYVRARAEGVGGSARSGSSSGRCGLLVLLFGAFVLGRTWMPVALGVIALAASLPLSNVSSTCFSQKERSA